jgi:hypothetical protein
MIAPSRLNRENTMKAIFAAAALAFIVVAPAFVAAPARAEESEAMKQAREIQKRQQDETDRAYRAALKNTSRNDAAAQARVDPWANARTPANGK